MAEYQYTRPMSRDIADAAGLLIPHWYRSVWQYDLDDGRAMFRAHLDAGYSVFGAI